jgi:hypothetical protein
MPLRYKKNAAGGVNGPHRFSLRESNTVSPDRGKIPKPWPMPVRAKPYGEHSEGIFLPTGGNSSQLGFELATSWGRPYLSSSNQLD